MVINSTFTAGGLSAPIFIAVYGLSIFEMPGDKMISISVPGLVAGSHMNIYSGGTGFITFVRGLCKQDSTVRSNISEQSNNIETSESTMNDLLTSRPLSKESQVAELYRKIVYHPLI